MVKEQKGDKYYGTGRRKCAVARVWIQPGSGQVTINNRPMDAFFARFYNRASVLRPLQLTELEGKLDVSVKVCGGGTTGQADAIRHGLSRALMQYDDSLRPTLKKNGMLMRDAREKERKKYGQPGARKRYQFSKR